MSLEKTELRCSNHLCMLKLECLRYTQVVADFHTNPKAKYPIKRFIGDVQDEFGRVMKCETIIKINHDDNR